MLNETQTIFYNGFERAVQHKEQLILSSHNRRWGKTTIINELGLTLQALGFQPSILTPTESHMEYFATNFIRDVEDLRDLDTNGLVVLVDEYKYTELQAVLLYCYSNHIPIVGFADFE